MPKETYLLFPVDPKTHKPNMDLIAIFTHPNETNKAKQFIKGSGMLPIIITVSMFDSYNEFKQLWEERVKCAMLGS